MIIKKTKEIKIFNFINKTYHINKKLASVSREKNKKIKIKGSTIAKLLFVGMLNREKSINQIMEKTHNRRKYKNIFSQKEVIPKMHGFREGIKDLKVEELLEINKSIIRKTKENKVYRAGTVENLVVVGIDGTECFGSYKKDWSNSYKTIKKNQKIIEGKKQIVEEEYHKQINVFAQIVGKRPGVILGYEKITCNGNEGKQEYEPNVAIRLIQNLKKIYGRGIDVIVGDAIYLKENVIEELKKEGYKGIIRLKNNQKGLIKDAEGVFKLEKGKKIKIKNKEIKYWSDIFEYKKEKIKIVKFEEEKREGNKEIIYVISTDVEMKEKTINKIIHARWDIENNGFNELKNYWNMKHCYIADEKAIDVILQMIIMSYNVWEVYLYRHLHNFEGMKITKIGYIEEVQERIYRATKEVIEFSSA